MKPVKATQGKLCMLQQERPGSAARGESSALVSKGVGSAMASLTGKLGWLPGEGGELTELPSSKEGSSEGVAVTRAGSGESWPLWEVWEW